MFLRDRDWSFPMEKLERRVFECFLSMRAEEFCSVLGDVKREWDFLSLIWKRLQDDYREFSKCEEAFRNQEMMKSLSREEISDFTRRNMLCFSLIHLDTEDCLIHSKILLDIIVMLAKTFFKDKIVKKGSEPCDRFTRFRNWFLESGNSHLILDVEFADYLKLRTHWFAKLKDARDDLIVHRKKRYYTDVITAEGKVGKAIGEFVEIENAVHCRIQEMPSIELDFLLDGIYDFLHFFDEHFSNMLGAVS
jgi:hypothetical protein